MTDPQLPNEINLHPGAPKLTDADRVWAECRRGAQRVAAEQELNPWSTRDILIAGMDSFAEHWDTRFGPFSAQDPDGVKELARWLRTYLRASGRVPDGR